jgi:hypothetical protein
MLASFAFLIYSSPLIFPPTFSSAYAAKASTPSATWSTFSLTASVASPAPLLTVSVASSKYSAAASYASPTFLAAKEDRMFALILSSSSLVGAREGDPRRPAILPVSVVSPGSSRPRPAHRACSFTSHASPLSTILSIALT